MAIPSARRTFEDLRPLARLSPEQRCVPSWKGVCSYTTSAASTVMARRDRRGVACHPDLEGVVIVRSLQAGYDHVGRCSQNGGKAGNGSALLLWKESRKRNRSARY